MDNFMDRIAQKMNAQEIIKANTMAEAEEMKRLQAKVTAYEEVMGKMQLQLTKYADTIDRMQQQQIKYEESAEKMFHQQKLYHEAAEQIISQQTAYENIAGLMAGNQDRIDSTAKRLEELSELCAQKAESIHVPSEEEELSVIREKLKEMFNESEEYVHKENVKVYRNVQAVVVEELKNQTESLREMNENLVNRIDSFKIFLLSCVILGGVNIVMVLFVLLRVLGII